MKYKVYYRKLHDGRAPSTVSLEDYEEAGSVTAGSKGEVAFKLQKAMPKVTTARSIRVGDMLQEVDGPFFIYTPSYRWSIVQIDHS